MAGGWTAANDLDLDLLLALQLLLVVAPLGSAELALGGAGARAAPSLLGLTFRHVQVRWKDPAYL